MVVRAGPPRPATAGVSRPVKKDQTMTTKKITDTTALPAAPAIPVQGATRPAKRPFDLDKLLRFMEAHGIRQWPDPDGYPYYADIPGLTPAALGYDRCAYVLEVLRRHLLAATDGDGTYFAWRDPRTGERLGYRVYTRDAATAARVAQDVARLLPVM